MAKNTGRTWFKPGHKSMGGRKKINPRLMSFIEKQCLPAAKILVEILENEESKDADKIKCAELLMAYGMGRPPQPVTDKDGNDVSGGIFYIGLPRKEHIPNGKTE